MNNEHSLPKDGPSIQDEIYEKQTVRALAASIPQKDAELYTAVTPAEPAAFYPLCSAQKRMYALFYQDRASIAYNMPTALIIDGDLDIGQLERAARALANRHEILRTTFDIVDGEPVQIVHDHSLLSLEYSTEPLADKPEKVLRNFIRPFDLGMLPLFRISVIRIEERKHLLMLDIHHIVTDRASVNLFITELGRLYNGEKLLKIPVQYKDFSVWQQKRKAQNRFLPQEQYWMEQFADGVPVLNLPYDFPRPVLRSFEGARVPFTIDAVQTASLKKLAADGGITLFMLLLSVYSIMLSKLSGQEEIVVGTPVSGRTQAELEDTMGMFVNAVPIKSRVSSDFVLSEFWARIRKNVVGAFENQAFPYEELAAKLDHNRDTGRNPLFDVMFVLQNMPENRFDFHHIHFSHYELEQTIAKFDLTLNGFEGGDGILYFDLEYSSHLFKRATAEKFVSYFKHIVQTVIGHPGARLSSITLQPLREMHQSINAAAAFRPPGNEREALVIEVFEETLGKRGIGAEDTFQELGGDSFSAIKAVFLLKQKGASVEARDLLLRQTAAAIGEMLLRRTESGSELEENPIGDGILHVQQNAGGREEGEPDGLSSLLGNIRVQQQAYERQLGKRPSTGRFLLTAIQSMHLKRSENLGFVMGFPAETRKEDIERAVYKLVCEQDMLRCFLSGKGSRSWSVHQIPKTLSLPFIRLTGQAAEVEEMLKRIVEEVYFGRFAYGVPGSLLYRLLLIENSTAGGYSLVYSSHHSLSDGLSCGLIADALSPMEIAFPSGDSVNSETGYQEYAKLLSAGPQGIGSSEIESRFGLLQYRNKLAELEARMESFPRGRSTSVMLEFPLKGDYPEEGWHLVLNLLKVFGREVLYMDEIPVQLVSNGRRYGSQTFYHLIGNFVDYIPLVMNERETEGRTLERIRELLRAASAHHINFISLDGGKPGKAVLLNYFGTLREEHASLANWIPDNTGYYRQASDFYGISFYVRHRGPRLRVDISLPFAFDPEVLKKRLSGASISER